MKFILYQFVSVLLLITFLFTRTYAQDTHEKDLMTLEAEWQLRPESMSKNFIATHYGLGLLKGDYNKWLNNKGKHKSTGFFPRFGKGVLRTAKLGLIDWWISNHFSMLNHELTGHAAYSVMTDQFYVDEMSLPFKLPIGKFHYLTKPSLAFADADAFVSTKVNSGYSVTQNDLAMLFIAGINASNTMRLNIEKNWFQSKKMHYNQSLLILQNHFDIFTYCLSTEYGSGTDVKNYLNFVNGLYLKFPDSLYSQSNSTLLINYAKENFKFTPSDVKQVAFVNTFGDPNLYYALSNIFFKYLIKGEAISNYKMISVKNVGLMPSIGANLTPWGIQYFGQLNLEVSGKKFSGIYHFGKNKYAAKYNGFSVQALNLFENDKLRLGAQVDFFNQPKLILGKKLEAGETYTAVNTTGGNGGMVSASLDYKILNKKVPIYLSTTVGYKSAGFIPGQSVLKTPIIALGLSFDVMNINSSKE